MNCRSTVTKAACAASRLARAGGLGKHRPGIYPRALAFHTHSESLPEGLPGGCLLRFRTFRLFRLMERFRLARLVVQRTLQSGIMAADQVFLRVSTLRRE